MKRALLLLLLPILCMAQAKGNLRLRGDVRFASQGHYVHLSWDHPDSDVTFNMYRGTVHNGPYVKIVQGLTVKVYDDPSVSVGQTYYYVATAIRNGVESRYSNEASAAIP